MQERARDVSTDIERMDDVRRHVAPAAEPRSSDVTAGYGAGSSSVGGRSYTGVITVRFC